MIQILLKALAVLGSLIAENRALKNDLKDKDAALAAALASESAKDTVIETARSEAASSMEKAIASSNRAIEAEEKVEELRTALDMATADDLDVASISAQFDALLSTLG